MFHIREANMKKKCILGLFLLIVGLQFACQKHEAASAPNGDSDITKVVKEKLKSDENISARDIDVKTENGVVTLSGEVETQADLDQAVQIARSVPEVRNVHSRVRVKQVLTDEDVKDRVKDQESKMEKKIDQAQDTTISESASDAALTAKVKMKLSEDSLLSALKINVDTKNAHVTLTGNVKDELEARRAIQIAESVKGVQQVTSVLTVKQ
jgi:hyperosmotically inducible protein